MHIADCDRCALDYARDVAYAKRMAARSTASFQKAEAKAELLRIARAQGWAKGEGLAAHPHRQGQRGRRVDNRIRHVRRALRSILRDRRPAVQAPEPKAA
jgi:hypothetical protein